jgi:hypothetical protein
MAHDRISAKYISGLSYFIELSKRTCLNLLLQSSQLCCPTLTALALFSFLFQFYEMALCWGAIKRISCIRGSGHGETC